jgi:hypothetical protein
LEVQPELLLPDMPVEPDRQVGAVLPGVAWFAEQGERLRHPAVNHIHDKKLRHPSGVFHNFHKKP